MTINWARVYAFRWIGWNLDKVAKHGVAPEEAEYVVNHARRPFPTYRGNGKWFVAGATAAGRWLQVIFLLDEDRDDEAFVIHARPLDAEEARRYRKQRK